MRVIFRTSDGHEHEITELGEIFAFEKIMEAAPHKINLGGKWYYAQNIVSWEKKGNSHPQTPGTYGKKKIAKKSHPWRKKKTGGKK